MLLILATTRPRQLGPDGMVDAGVAIREHRLDGGLLVDQAQRGEGLAPPLAGGALHLGEIRLDGVGAGGAGVGFEVLIFGSVPFLNIPHGHRVDADFLGDVAQGAPFGTPSHDRFIPQDALALPLRSREIPPPTLGAAQQRCDALAVGWRHQPMLHGQFVAAPVVAGLAPLAVRGVGRQRCLERSSGQEVSKLKLTFIYPWQASFDF